MLYENKIVENKCCTSTKKATAPQLKYRLITAVGALGSLLIVAHANAAVINTQHGSSCHSVDPRNEQNLLTDSSGITNLSTGPDNIEVICPLSKDDTSMDNNFTVHLTQNNVTCRIDSYDSNGWLLYQIWQFSRAGLANLVLAQDSQRFSSNLTCQLPPNATLESVTITTTIPF